MYYRPHMLSKIFFLFRLGSTFSSPLSPITLFSSSMASSLLLGSVVATVTKHHHAPQSLANHTSQGSDHIPSDHKQPHHSNITSDHLLSAYHRLANTQGNTWKSELLIWTTHPSHHSLLLITITSTLSRPTPLESSSVLHYLSQLVTPKITLAHPMMKTCRHL